MKKLTFEQMEKIEGGGMLACAGMVLVGVAAVGAAVTLCAAGPLGWAGLASIGGWVGGTLLAADQCAQ